MRRSNGQAMSGDLFLILHVHGFGHPKIHQMGDPAGVGSEVTAKALADGRFSQRCRPFVIGSAAAMDEALRIIDSPVTTRVANSLEDVSGEPGAIDVLDLENLGN